VNLSDTGESEKAFNLLVELEVAITKYKFDSDERREPDYMEIARRRIEHWAQQQPMLI